MFKKKKRRRRQKTDNSNKITINSSNRGKKRNNNPLLLLANNKISRWKKSQTERRQRNKSLPLPLPRQQVFIKWLTSIVLLSDRREEVAGKLQSYHKHWFEWGLLNDVRAAQKPVNKLLPTNKTTNRLNSWPKWLRLREYNVVVSFAPSLSWPKTISSRFVQIEAMAWLVDFGQNEQKPVPDLGQSNVSTRINNGCIAIKINLMSLLLLLLCRILQSCWPS